MNTEIIYTIYYYYYPLMIACCIKCSYNGYSIDEELLKDVVESKIMGLASYIKCFYHFKDNDVEDLGNNTYRLSLSKESADELVTFNEEYALLIYDVPKFIERFSDACKNNKNIDNYFYSDVIYIDDDDYPKYEKDLIDGALGQKTEGIINPAFKWKKEHVQLGNVLADIKDGVPVDVIDEKLSDRFSERDVESLSVFIQRHLPDSEKKKIDLAFELYLKHEYFASAVLLAGLIDSVSINQFMKTNPTPANVSQCWKCYGNVIQDNFGGTYFSGDFPANKSAKDDKRANGTIDFF